MGQESPCRSDLSWPKEPTCWPGTWQAQAFRAFSAGGNRTTLLGRDRVFPARTGLHRLLQEPWENESCLFGESRISSLAAEHPPPPPVCVPEALLCPF